MIFMEFQVFSENLLTFSLQTDRITEHSELSENSFFVRKGDYYD